MATKKAATTSKKRVAKAKEDGEARDPLAGLKKNPKLKKVVVRTPLAMDLTFRALVAYKKAATLNADEAVEMDRLLARFEARQ